MESLKQSNAMNRTNSLSALVGEADVSFYVDDNTKLLPEQESHMVSQGDARRNEMLRLAAWS
jgi:hypothetical protein